MILSLDQQNALDAFSSGKNILVLGDPGTGKSTLISALTAQAEAKGRKVARTASTGIAAQLIGGATLHSFLRAYPGMDLSGIDYIKKVDKLEKIDVLIVDEISMIGCSFIEYLFRCLQYVYHPVQLVLVGDFFQLPPVKDSYAFTSPYWDLLRLTPCILKQVVRQQDSEFIHHINELKYGNEDCLPYLLTHSCQTPLPGQISICATRADAQCINRTELDKLHGPPQIYMAEYEGSIFESDLRVEECLIVKKGLRVMSVINGIGYSNGSLGTITDYDPYSVEVLFDTGSIACFRKDCFTADRKDLVGETTDVWQIPLRPAYAITIHKSQGQTFNYVNIDGTKCWAPGQLYVAVSRARNIEGIHFLTPIKRSNIKTDPVVVRFYESLHQKHHK